MYGLVDKLFYLPNSRFPFSSCICNMHWKGVGRERGKSGQRMTFLHWNLAKLLRILKKMELHLVYLFTVQNPFCSLSTKENSWGMWAMHSFFSLPSVGIYMGGAKGWGEGDVIRSMEGWLSLHCHSSSLCVEFCSLVCPRILQYSQDKGRGHRTLTIHK